MAIMTTEHFRTPTARPDHLWHDDADPVAVIRAVLRDNPDLNYEGSNYGITWRDGALKLRRLRAEMTKPEAVQEFLRAIRFLAEHERFRVQRVNRCRNSYSWKHVVERWIRPTVSNYYVSNGMFIAAALAMGYETRAESPLSQNVFINISEGAVTRDRRSPSYRAPKAA